MYRYKIFKSDNKVIALGSFAGKTIRGVAKCNPEDAFSEEFGEKLATARCEEKLANKRMQYAHKKFIEANAALQEAQEKLAQVSGYYANCISKYEEAVINVSNLLENISEN